MIIENPAVVLIVVFFLGSGLVFLLLLLTAIRIVPADKRLSVHRLGRHIGERGPGLVLLIPFIERGILVDPKMVSRQVRSIHSDE